MTTREACVRRTKDRVSNKDLIDVVELGDIHLNAFLTYSEPDTEKFPLTLAYSPESQLVQLRHSVDPELMYRTYWYRSGTNESMAQHLKNLANDAMQRVILNPRDVVVDIGCNDGTLLKCFPDWVRKIGYDPAKDLNPGCDLFINDFFDPAPYAGNQPAKIVTSIAMFYDIDDPVSFARGVASIMHDEGLWIIEMHYLPTMLEKNEVDAICHEHLCYYSVVSLSYVLREAGLAIADVSFNNANGGSMRAFVKKAWRIPAPNPHVQNIVANETRVDIAEQLAAFDARIQRNRDFLLGMLSRLNKDSLVYGYGASTKGNTLLQYTGIDFNILPSIADRNPEKHGRFTVGSHIPIISEEQMRNVHPEYLLALPYHFIESFRKREDASFKWILPVPEPKIIS